jgi:hypothetical protein
MGAHRAPTSDVRWRRGAETRAESPRRQSISAVRIGLTVAALVAAAVVAAFGRDARAPEMVSAGGPAEQGPLPSQGAPAGARQFEELLGHHVFLMARSMRGQASNQPDAAQAFRDALVSNTDQLSAAIGSLYGDQYTAPFRQLWYSHVFLLTDYARAVSQGDSAARDAARSALEQYRTEYGTFIESMTAGAIPAQTAADNLRAHLDHLMSHIDAYVAGDYDTAYAVQREGYAHMFPTAATLVSGATPPIPGELPTGPDDPSEQLRSRLSMLLGEHFQLAVDVTRSGLTGAADFTEVADSLNANTRDLTEAFDSLFGAEAATAFNQLWASHIDALVRYTVATAQGDATARQGAIDELTQVAHGLGATFSQLTAGAVPVDDAVALLTMHDDQLVQQVNAYNAKDYEMAQRLSFDGYSHMFDTADALVAGIETALVGNLPVGGVQTGGGYAWVSAHAH